MDSTGKSNGLLVERRGALGLLTLDKPEATNVLSLDLLRRLRQALQDFAEDSDVDAVLVRSNGRVFSSGGDIYSILAHQPGPDFEALRREYFTIEFALDRRIRHFPKPYIGLVDGLTIGGGCGVALLGQYVVATERTVLSLPETAIGYFPDAGATWLLNQLPGEMGVYVGLRGQRLNGSDALALGLATHYLASESLTTLVDDLTAEKRLPPSVVSLILERYASNPGPSPIASRQARVDELFCGDGISAILSRLDAAPEGWAQATAATLRHVCPTSLKATLRTLRAVRGQSFDVTIITEYRVSVRMTGRPDFREGVRAVLIDKDNQPRWSPASIGAVSDTEIGTFLSPLAPSEQELEFA